jgi:hypothetical protein
MAALHALRSLRERPQRREFGLMDMSHNVTLCHEIGDFTNNQKLSLNFNRTNGSLIQHRHAYDQSLQQVQFS